MMQTNTTIEDIVMRELKALCKTCIRQHECVYLKTSTKAIIQCELFVLDQEQVTNAKPSVGLCQTCDHASHCTLPGRKHGVWRCVEFS